MDGHFVPNITFGPPVVKSIRKATSLYLDVHLMIEKPERYIDSFLEAGSDRITIHVEATDQAEAILTSLKERGKGAGITLRPDTPIETVLPLLPLVDLLLIMTVEPGFGGQSLIQGCLDKIGPAVAAREKWGEEAFWIQVDGGINKETIALARRAGAEIIVAGSAVFGAPDIGQAFQMLQKGAAQK